MKIWYDCEFDENGKTIELISIGAVREDGHTFYAESSEYDRDRATPWLKQHVIPLLGCQSLSLPRFQIADEFRAFAGDKPQFWAWYGAYDWVALCQLYGQMIDLPKGWPFMVMDLKQLAMSLGDPKVPPQQGREHHALDDALHARDIDRFLTRVKVAA